MSYLISISISKKKVKVTYGSMRSKKWIDEQVGGECTWLSYDVNSSEMSADPANNTNCGILIVERTDGTVNVSVDHFASLPLFWSQDDQGVVNCSNIFEKVATPVQPSEPDPVAFWESTLFETPFLSRTLLKNVFVLEQETTLVVSKDGKTSVRRYGYLTFPDISVPNIDEMAEQAVYLLSSAFSTDSNSKYLFPMGGGLDSRWSLGVLSQLVPAKRIHGMTYGYRKEINEFRFAKACFQRLGIGDYSFHRLGRDSYLRHTDFLTKRTGGLIGVGNTHCLDYLVNQRKALSGKVLISNMFSDAICGYAASSDESTDRRFRIDDTSYYKRLMSAAHILHIPEIIVQAVIADLDVLATDAKLSTIKTLEEYIYIRERNTKFQLLMSDVWRRFMPVQVPFARWNVARFFLGLPNHLRYEKKCVHEILSRKFPELARIGVISSLDNARGHGIWWKNTEQRLVNKINRVLNYQIGIRFSLIDRYATEDRRRLLRWYFQAEYNEMLNQIAKLWFVPSEATETLHNIEQQHEPSLFQLFSNVDVLGQYSDVR